MGVINSFEMVHPDRQSGCNGHCSAYSPLHRAIPPSFCENPVLLRDPSVDGAATWALGMCLQNGGAGELGRTQEA